MVSGKTCPRSIVIIRHLLVKFFLLQNRIRMTSQIVLGRLLAITCNFCLIWQQEEENDKFETKSNEKKSPYWESNPGLKVRSLM